MYLLPHQQVITHKINAVKSKVTARDDDAKGSLAFRAEHRPQLATKPLFWATCALSSHRRGIGSH